MSTISSSDATGHPDKHVLDSNAVGLVTSGALIPIWLQPSPDIGVRNNRYEKLSSDLTCDVLIIGAGIAGLSVGYELLERGRQVVIIDDGLIGSGETGRTTAMLNSVPDDHIFSIQSMYGKEAAKLCYESMKTALDRMEEIISKEQINCEWERLPAHLIVGCDVSHPDYAKEVRMLAKELEACHQVGFTDVKIVDNIQSLVPGINPGQALVYPHQAQYHPMKYLNGLADAIVKKGGKIYTETHAQEIKGGDKAEVETLEKNKIHPRVIVQATNIPITNRITIIDRLENLRTYLIGAELPAGFPSLQIDDLEEPYHYIRTVRSGDSGENVFLLVGGEDHPVGEDNIQKQNEKFSSLESWMRARWPSAGPVKYQWSGQIQEPVDQLFIIGQNPHDEENVFISTADSGNGMIAGPVAGILLADTIIGKNNPWKDLYSPKRKPIKALGTYIKHSAEMATRYRRWVTGSDVKDIEDIQPCKGAVLLKGMKYEAVYKDENGKCSHFDAVCPHLGAIIKWNESEMSWDCPAHGSRWSKDGAIINGPAKSNLEIVQQA